MIRLSEVAQATGGVLIGADCMCSGVSTDSRGELAAKLFVALKGDKFDAHDFLPQVVVGGAAAVLVSAGKVGDGFAVPRVEVDDPRLALGRLAAWWRARFAIPLIGVTGSNGKTTVKEMIAAILRAEHGEILATTGNLNNDIGVPLMLLQLTASHRAAVIEMGMNHPGEIAYLANMARPTVGLVTNAQRAHLAGMGELDAVAEEKGALLRLLASDGAAIINADDAHAAYWAGLCQTKKRTTFGLSTADVQASFQPLPFGSRVVLRTPAGSAEFELCVPGIHNVRNAAAAAAACLAAGVSVAKVAEGLEGFSGAKGRLQVKTHVSGAVLVDDTYNANPDSVAAAIDVLASSAGRKVLVLGDMGEIGEMSAQCHDEIGGYAKSQGVDRLFAIGEHSVLAAKNFGAGGCHFDSIDELVAALEPLLSSEVVVLVKGSRFMRMERVIEALAVSSGPTVKV